MNQRGVTAILTVFVLLIVLASIPVGVYLVNHPQILKSKASELKSVTQPSSIYNMGKTVSGYDGYIIELKSDPISVHQKKISGSQLNKDQSLITSYRQTLESEHAQAKSDILSRLGKKNLLKSGSSSKDNLVVRNDFLYGYNGLAVDISDAEVDKAKQSPFVKQVYKNNQIHVADADSNQLMNVPSVWSMVDSQGRFGQGQGQTIAVLDTGVDYSSPDLGSTPLAERTLQKINSQPLQLPAGESFNTDQILSIDSGVLAYPSGNNIYLYKFSTGEIQTVNLFAPNLQVYKLALSGNLLAYEATDSQLNGGLYLYDLNSQTQKKITDTQLFSLFGIGDNKVVFTQSTGLGIYVYDVASGVITQIYSSNAIPKVSGNLVAYSTCDPSCYTNLQVYNLDTHQTQTFNPINIGPLLDFQGSKVLYASVDPLNFDPTWNIFYLYDINTGQSTRLQYPSSSGLIGSNSMFAKQIIKAANTLSVYYGNTKGSIGNGTVFFTKNANDWNIVNFDQNLNRYVEINLNTPSGAQSLGSGDKICFLSEDFGIYCHSYDPSYSYPMPTNIFNSKVIGGFNFVDNTTDPLDNQGHGTHVSGIAAGNGAVSGVAPAARIVAYKVMNAQGTGYSSTVMQAIDQAVQNNLSINPPYQINVLTMSLGSFCGSSYSISCGPDDPLSTTADNAVSVGMVVTTAAGNSGSGSGPGGGTINSPGTSRSAITVGAIDNSKVIASFSSVGPINWNGKTIAKPDVVAPGVNICSVQWDSFGLTSLCFDKKHISLSGTSMSTPQVAGIAALVGQLNPSWSSGQIKSAIIGSATNLGYSVDVQGAGLVNAQAAVSFANPTPTPSLTPTPTLTPTPSVVYKVWGTTFLKKTPNTYITDLNNDSDLTTNNSNYPVVTNVQISISGAGSTAGTTSGAKGHFVFSNLSNQPYTVTAVAPPGFMIASQNPLQINTLVQLNTFVYFVLAPNSN